MSHTTALAFAFSVLALGSGALGCATSRNAAEATGNGVNKAGQGVEDRSISIAVDTALGRDELVEADAIDVDTKDGVVTLTGRVPTEAARQRALSIAQQADGVKHVIDNMVVAPAAGEDTD